MKFLSKIRKINLGITFKLIVIVTIIISLALFALGYIINNSISEKIEKVSLDRNFDVASLLEKEVNNYLEDVEENIIKIAGNYGIRSNNQVELVIKRKFREELEGNDKFSSMFFIGKDELLIVLPEIEEEIVDYYSNETKWYDKVKNKEEVYWTSAHSNPAGDGNTFSVVYPVKDYSGEFIGIIGGNISTDKLSDIIGWQIGESGNVFMTDKYGKIVAHTDKKLLSQNIDMDEFLDIEKLLTKNKGSKIYEDNGEKKLLSYIKVEAMEGAIMAQLPAEEAYALQNNIRNIVIKTALIILFTLILSLFFLIDYSMIRPIIKLKDKMNKVEAGNFEIDISIARNDEIGVLAKGFGSMVSKIKSIISSIEKLSRNITTSANSINNSSEEIMVVSNEVSNSVEKVRNGANVQRKNVDEVNEKIKILDKGIEKLEESNQLLQEMAQKMTKATESGEDKVIDLKEQMFMMKNTVTKAAVDIQELHNISSDIDSILDIINGIAKQTNLLALNASIEAARAGSAGNGFSVVANEIRNLSEESTESAEKISTLIDKIKEKTENASKNMTESKEEIETGIKTVKETNLAFENIESSLLKIKAGIDESTKFAKKSKQNSKDIVSNMENIAGVSQENFVLAEEFKDHSKLQLGEVEKIIKRTDDLANMIAELNKLIKKFKN
ncbi:MAG: methyl-accepting chemotaxis protein [Bacillota bacterium]